MAHQIIWEGSNVIINCDGTFTSKDMIDSGNTLYGDKRYDEMSFQIIDLRKIDSFSITPKDVQVFATLDQSSSMWNNNIKLAFITEDRALIDLLKGYRSILVKTNWKVEFFKNIEEAETWVA